MEVLRDMCGASQGPQAHQDPQGHQARSPYVLIPRMQVNQSVQLAVGGCHLLSVDGRLLSCLKTAWYELQSWHV